VSPGRRNSSAPTVFAITLGCPKNRVDTEVMLGDLLSHGWELAGEPGRADVLLVNTCGFLKAAREESVDTLREVAREMKPGARLVAAGCMTERFRRELAREVPEAGILVGTRELLSLRDRLEGKRGPVGSFPTAANPRLVSTTERMAYIKVADGCSRRCSFCLIPRLKGRQRSRPAADIVEESANLAATGTRELVLVAQDLVHYGTDLPERPSLASLVRSISGQVPQLRWIRLMYLFPRDLSDELLDCVADCDNVLPYLDIPVQHADDRVLAAMRRGTTRKSLETLVERVRAKVPGCVLRTTYMVGFPGETDIAFDNLLSFAEQARFEMAGVFEFSAEPGSMAAGLPEQVPAHVRAERSRALQSLLDRIASKTRGDMEGEVHEAVIEATDPTMGRFWFQAPEVDGAVRLDGRGADVDVGEFIRARIIGARDIDFLGTAES